MRKIAFLLLLLLVSAWNWPTHKEFAVKIYDSFPNDIRSNLNVSIIEEGSIMPDSVFQDFEYHSYPSSVKKADYWLKASKDFYDVSNYSLASLSLGIATHYISDSFAAPHNINGEEYSQHAKFEKEAEGVPFLAKCAVGEKDAEQYLSKGQLSEKDWGFWLRKKDLLIQSRELSNALEAGYALSHAYYEKECYQSLGSRLTGFFVMLKFRFS